MMYIGKINDENDCSVGDKVMVLADFVGVEAGDKGTIVEIYDKGVMVQWDKQENPERPLRDGFSRQELSYLAFAFREMNNF